jgi:predicted hydrolase (HD superfamily)
MREKSFELLKEYTKTDSLIKHALAVEASMIGYSDKFKENKEEWASCGLLHDLDYEMYPDKHPYESKPILEKAGYSTDFINAILGHADYSGVKRDSLMAKTLYAVDELSSFIIAAVLVRPDKFKGLEVKSIKKKLKDKAFARAVDRECIYNGAIELGIELDEHIQNIIDYLTLREEELSKSGISLL